MGLGPVPAIRELLAAAALTMDDMDMTEVTMSMSANRVHTLHTRCTPRFVFQLTFVPQLSFVAN